MNKYDVFITSTIGRSPERRYFSDITKRAIFRQRPFIDSKFIYEPMLKRYFVADRLSTSEIFILCDDDIIPATPSTFQELVTLLIKYPEYGQIGLSWKRYMDSERQSNWAINTHSNEIWEWDHIGGCVAIRKDSIKDLGYITDYRKGIGDDKIIAKITREMGYKVGLAPHLYFHHLGEGFSTVWV